MSSDLAQQVATTLRANADQSARLDLIAAELFGVNRTDSRAVELLSRLGAMTAKELAGHLRMTTGGVTTVIDRLERAGYVRRRSDPKDRRRVLLDTTEKQRRLERELFGDLIAQTYRVVSAYDRDQLQVIGRFLREVGAELAAHNDRLEQKKQRRRRSVA